MKTTIGNHELVTVRRIDADNVAIVYHLGRGYPGPRHPGSLVHNAEPEWVLRLVEEGNIRVASPSRAWRGRCEDYRAISIIELRSMVLDRATRVRRGRE